MLRTIGFLASFWLSGVAVAGPVPIPGTQPVGPIFNRADIVCACRVISSIPQTEEATYINNKHATRRHIAAAVQIIDIYKGPLSAGTVLNVEYDEENPVSRPMPSLRTGDFAILFLKQTAASAYEFVDPFLGVTRFSTIPQETGVQGIAKMESALEAVIEQPNGDDQIRAIRLLAGLDTLQANTIAILTARSSSPDPEVALASLAALLRAAPGSGVQNLERFLQTYTGDEKHISFATIGHELAQIHTPEVERSLELLTSSRFRSVRFGAMEGLRNLKDLHSVPTLAARLDDEDVNVRYIAVITLAELFHKDGDYGPTMKTFEKNPSLYTTLWKEWWKQQVGKGL